MRVESDVLLGGLSSFKASCPLIQPVVLNLFEFFYLLCLKDGKNHFQPYLFHLMCLFVCLSMCVDSDIHANLKTQS